ncbi:meiosis 1 arrest protein-like [Apostichopus japonicus]|uniref:meiosis 1 arrest protein-like n=1 Tax=Stichopus japonicus TaxID=307972 RepID=UPI003AB2FAF9
MSLPKPPNPSRAVFARQPARVLLVDFTPPFSSATCQSVCNGLDNLFTLVCNMTGPCRVPYFGLFALGSFSENLFPLQHVQGNYPRIQNALGELRAFQRDGFLMNERKDYLLQAVQDAIHQFKKQSQTLRQTTGFTSQLEVLLMTCQKNASTIAKQIEDAIVGSLDVENLRRIQVISLIHGNPLGIPMELSPSTGSPHSGAGSQQSVTSIESVLESGIVEMISLDTDELGLQNFLNGWLQDCGTDRECLYIRFPRGDTGQEFKLTCDILEQFIDPAQLNIAQSEFALNIPCPGSKRPMVSAGSLMKPSSTLTVPIPTLKVIKLVKISGICESVVFGVPLILKPTACWKLPWNELEKNQQHFQALCYLLQSKDLAVLVQRDVTSPPADSSFSGGGVYQNPLSIPTQAPSSSSSSIGHFLILPSPGTTMLIKSVAIKELMLPSDAHEKGDAPLSETIKAVQKVLDQLEVTDIYNPLSMNSGLQSSLRRALCKGSVRKTAKRPRTQSGRIQATRGHNGVRGQSSRGHGSKGQAVRGRGIPQPLGSTSTGYQPPLVKTFENFFPDFED